MRTLCWIASLAALAAADVAVRRDGRVVRAPLIAVAEKRGRLTWGEERPHQEPLRVFLLVERDNGALVWSAGPKSRIRGYAALARVEQARLLVPLVKSAVKARDPRLARALYERADALGLDGKDSDSLRRRVEKLEAKPARKVNAGLVVTVKAAALRLDRVAGRIFAQRARVALKKDRVTGLRILRAGLLLDPGSSEALALLAKLADKEFGQGDARAWLDWVLFMQRRGFRPAGGDELELKRARHYWRPDLYGVRTDDLLLISAVKDFATAGRCLAHAQLVVDALKSVFRTDKPVARTRAPLVVLLYMDRKAYRDHAGDYRKIVDPSFLEWATANWSQVDDITRAFWPSDPDAERRFLRVFRREIVRHWMNSRNPRYSVSQAGRSWRTKGWWLAFGFREIVAQGIYDIDKRTWDFFNPRNRELDQFRALIRQQPARLHSWKTVCSLSGRQASKLPDKTDIATVTRWSLGTWYLSSYHLFQAQATAACHYLAHADKGKHRAALIEAVVAHYSGREAGVDTRSAFGLTPEELGRKATEFAKRVAGTRVPGDKG